MSARAPDPAARASARRPFARLAVTLAAPILVGLAARIPLPGIDRRVVGDLGVLGLGLAPFVSAFVLVEVAALIVPAWRPLRVGGRAGRAPLATAAAGLGLLLAVIQAWGVVQFARSAGALPGGALARALAALTLVAGTAALAWVPEHRLYAADAALAALTGAGIPAFARGVHYRTLGQFFTPYVPVEILVPAGRAAEAEVVLRRVLAGEGAPAQRPAASA